MSGFDINALTENASRLGQRLQETFSEHTRELAKAPSAIYFDNPEDKLKNIRKQLDSNSDREKLDAMKRLVALISKGRNVSEFFAQVVKNVASQNLEVRKLVYIYLLRYAEQEPDLALLSINTFQKDLTDSNPLIRAMALRVLSGIKVPMIGNIVVLAIKKCAADISPYVRKAAALAIPKCYNLDSSHLPALIGIISTLLRDRSPLSIGSVAVAFEAVCPTRLDLLHPHYRRLCRTLVDVDEWGQVDLLNFLIRYARTMLPRPIVTSKEDQDGKQVNDEFVDADLQLLLSNSEPLLQSRNPSVVMAVIRVLYYLGPPSYLNKAVQPLLRLLEHSKEVERVVLVYARILAQKSPTLLSSHYSRFLIRSDDLHVVKQEKIRLLLTILTVGNHQALLREFNDYAEDVDDELVAVAVRAIGHCARIIPDCTQQCLTALLNFIKSKHDIIVSNAVVVLKSLVQTQMQYLDSAIHLSKSKSTTISIISRLAYRIDDIRHPQARACVIWLVGQYAAASPPEAGDKHSGIEGIAPWAPDVLRNSAKTFLSEDPLVKLQIITLAAKLLVLAPADRTLGLLGGYVFSLARYDADYDLRDRARMLSSLLISVVPALKQDESGEIEEQGGVVLRQEQVRLVLFEGKSQVVEKESWLGDEQLVLGSVGAVTGKEMRGDHYLPDWLEQGAEPLLRDTDDDMPQVPQYAKAAPRSIGPSTAASPIILTPTGGTSPMGSGTPGTTKSQWDDLDKFYAEEEDEEDDEEDDDDDEEEEDDDDDDDDESEESEEEEAEHVQSNGHRVEEEHSHHESDDEDSPEDEEDNEGGGTHERQHIAIEQGHW